MVDVELPEGCPESVLGRVTALMTDHPGDEQVALGVGRHRLVILGCDGSAEFLAALHDAIWTEVQDARG